MRIAHQPHPALVISVVGTKLVAVGHYAERDGRTLAAPEMILYTGYGAAWGWVPVTYRHDPTGVHRQPTTVAHGQVIGFMPAEVARDVRVANQWATTLVALGYLTAARTPKP